MDKLPPSLSKKIEESFKAKHHGLSAGVTRMKVIRSVGESVRGLMNLNLQDDEVGVGTTSMVCFDACHQIYVSLNFHMYVPLLFQYTADDHPGNDPWHGVDHVALKVRISKDTILDDDWRRFAITEKTAEVSDPDRNKGKTSLEVGSDTNTLILMTVGEIQALLEDSKDELKDDTNEEIYEAGEEMDEHIQQTVAEETQSPEPSKEQPT
ncbi:hypothetical protein Tco_1474248 [Tanacetum coccineum]